MSLSENRENAFGRRHYRDLDGVRGVLAFGVVLFHFGINGAIQKTTGWPGFVLPLCVDVFFMLSGFVLAKSFDSNVRRFAIKRVWRLAPVYFATLALVAVVAPQRITSPAELLLAPPLFGISPANFPSWSIAWELYLPILGVAITRYWLPPWKPTLIIALTILSVLTYYVAQDDVLGGWRAASGLIAGACLTKMRPIALPILPFVILILAIMALAARWPLVACALPAATALMILTGTQRNGLFALAPFQFLGAISFTIYMVHAPVLIALGDRAQGSVGWKLVGLIVSIFGAWALTRWIELPGMQLGRRLIEKRSGSASTGDGGQEQPKQS